MGGMLGGGVVGGKTGKKKVGGGGELEKGKEVSGRHIGGWGW